MDERYYRVNALPRNRQTHLSNPQKPGGRAALSVIHLFDLNRRAGNAKQWHRRIFLRLDNHLEQLASLFGHTGKTCPGRRGPMRGKTITPASHRCWKTAGFNLGDLALSHA